jgi:hypothetical protein
MESIHNKTQEQLINERLAIFTDEIEFYFNDGFSMEEAVEMAMGRGSVFSAKLLNQAIENVRV